MQMSGAAESKGEGAIVPPKYTLGEPPKMTNAGY